MIRKTSLIAATVIAAAACSSTQPSVEKSGGDRLDLALEAIDANDLKRHTKTLSSDAYGGRAPFSEGEAKTLDYLTAEFKKRGFQPGNGDSYLQPVELVSIEASASPMTFMARGETHELTAGEDMVVWTKRVVDSSELMQSPLVFVGYGVVAPEYDWNDYSGVDMDGKTAVILVNDPGYATQDADLFGGNAMTYYGRWTYKYEEAARQGAAGAIIIHETGAAGYPWEVVAGSWSGAQFDLSSPNGNRDRVAIEGWITQERGRQLFESAGSDYESLLAAAASGRLKPTMLDASVSVAVTNTNVTSTSFNVAAVLPGATTPEETFVYMAHWDHLGTAPGMDGDNIFNGAVDNATGLAGLIEIAEAYAALPSPPARSIMLLAVTAEESGLLGSAHYGANPLVPLNKTVGGINMDSMNVLGPTRDVVVVGKGNSELEIILEEEARKQGRTLVQEPTPEKGLFYRSDHFNFAKRGVPVLYAKSGIDYIDHDRAWGLKARADYTSNRYHKVSDEYDDSWSMGAATQDAHLYFSIGYRVANGDEWPNWFKGNEFRAIRDASMQ